MTQNSLLAIVACGLLLFISLGRQEVQPWDEAFYALRARAVVEHDARMDQTQYALGGLYSSTYPPLSVWAIAASMRALGQSPFAVRLFSAACGFASLFLIYAIALHLFNAITAVLAPLLLTSTLVWNHYARQAMTDIPLLMWILLCLLALLRCSREPQRMRKLLWCCVFALAFAAALMTKIVVSFLPLFLLAYFVLQRYFPSPGGRSSASDAHSAGSEPSRIDVVMLSAAAVAGILLALPWHIFMIDHHHQEFSAAFLLPHIGSVVEANTSWLGPAYYLNQLLVTQPLSIMCLAWFGLSLAHRRKSFSRSTDTALELLCASWFISTLILLSVSATKNPHYLLLLLVPCILLALRGMELVAQFHAHTRTGVMIVTVVLLCLLWSSNQSLRTEVQGLLRWEVSATALVVVTLSVGLMVVSALLGSHSRQYFFSRVHKAMTTVIPVLLVFRIAAVNAVTGEASSEGARKVGAWLEESQVRDFVYLVHAHNASDTLAPQLSWYTRGWAGFTVHKPWRPERSYRYIILPEHSSDSNTLAWLDTISVPIVYAIPADDSLARIERGSIASRHRQRLETPSYIVYSRRTYTNVEPMYDAHWLGNPQDPRELRKNLAAIP